MKIQFKLQATKNPLKKIYVRMYQGDFDIQSSTNLLVSEFTWDQKNQKCSNLELDIKIQKLKIFIAESFNNDYFNGVSFDKDWLIFTIGKFFNRVDGSLMEDKHKVYFSDFISWWLTNFSSKWKVSATKLMDDRLKYHYELFLSKILLFEKANKKIKLVDITNDFMYDFVSYLKEQNYGSKTIQNDIVSFKFFCNRVLEKGFAINKDFKQRVIVDKQSSELEGVYLNESEIKSLYNLDLSHDYRMDNARDNLIISCYTGLRISDFMDNLHTENIKDNVISIKTQKTGSFVKIPLHPMVKDILDKRFGNLPIKMTSTEYNKRIKTVCMLAGIDSVMYGSVMDKKTKRKKLGYYKKYELITSHVGRKSLATNLFGKVPNEVIQAIAGWSNSTMLNYYNKTTKSDYAKQLNDFWSEK